MLVGLCVCGTHQVEHGLWLPELCRRLVVLGCTLVVHLQARLAPPGQGPGIVSKNDRWAMGGFEASWVVG